METLKCGACGLRPANTGESLCATCRVLGPERHGTLPVPTEYAQCGCSKFGRCSYHSATDAIGVDDVQAWYQVGALWAFEREHEREAAQAVEARTLVVDGKLAASVAGRPEVLACVWLPDGRAEVTVLDPSLKAYAPAVLVPFGLLNTDVAMRAITNPNTSHWSRWEWRGDAHKARTARDICRECGADTSARRTRAHVCGERLDSRGRAIMTTEERARLQRGKAAKALMAFMVKRGKLDGMDAGKRAELVARVTVAGITID